MIYNSFIIHRIIDVIYIYIIIVNSMSIYYISMIYIDTLYFMILSIVVCQKKNTGPMVHPGATGLP